MKNCPPQLRQRVIRDISEREYIVYLQKQKHSIIKFLIDCEIYHAGDGRQLYELSLPELQKLIPRK